MVELMMTSNRKPGSEIVVATTGGRASMGESEKMVRVHNQYIDNDFCGT